MPCWAAIHQVHTCTWKCGLIRFRYCSSFENFRIFNSPVFRIFNSPVFRFFSHFRNIFRIFRRFLSLIFRIVVNSCGSWDLRICLKHCSRKKLFTTSHSCVRSFLAWMLMIGLVFGVIWGINKKNNLNAHLFTLHQIEIFTNVRGHVICSLIDYICVDCARYAHLPTFHLKSPMNREPRKGLPKGPFWSLTFAKLKNLSYSCFVASNEAIHCCYSFSGYSGYIFCGLSK